MLLLGKPLGVPDGDTEERAEGSMDGTSLVGVAKGKREGGIEGMLVAGDPLGAPDGEAEGKLEGSMDGK